MLAVGRSSTTGGPRGNDSRTLISDEDADEDAAARGPGMRDQGETASAGDVDDDEEDEEDEEEVRAVGAAETDGSSWHQGVKRGSEMTV